MIEIKNIFKSFGKSKVLHDISAKFERGKTNLIIGQSGSGKTVLLKCLLGLYSFDQGEEADRLEAAVESVLADGFRTADLLGEEGVDPVTTQQMGDAILVALNSTL